jgi:predicted nucleic acid-binding protein
VIVLDASVLIGHLDSNDAHHRRSRRLLLATGSRPLGASPISLAETFVAPARAGRLDKAHQALDRLGVVELALGEATAPRLAELRAGTGCKLPDCCVLLAAQQHGGAVASFDAGLVRAAGALGLETLESGPDETVLEPRSQGPA